MAKQDYLLTDEELSDHTVLPCMTKPNPHKATWSEMQLYLSAQVEKFAIEKWGSLEAIQDEIEKRTELKHSKKVQRFNSKVKGMCLLYCILDFLCRA